MAGTLYADALGRPLTQTEVDRLHQLIVAYLGDVDTIAEQMAVVSVLADVHLRRMTLLGVPIETFLRDAPPALTIADAMTRYGLSPQHVREIEYARDNATLLIKSWRDDIRTDLPKIVNNGIRAQLHPRELASILTDRFVDYNRDMTRIAETEIASATNNGTIAGVAVGGHVLGQSFPNACAWCRRNIHGKVMKVVAAPKPGETRDWATETWPGKSNFGRYQSPIERGTGRHRTPDELWVACPVGHPSCFPAGVFVSGPVPLASATRWFDGEIVEIETVGGHFLPVTPNHPILSSQGWVAAGKLVEGDDVFCGGDCQWMSSNIRPHDYEVPSLIEDVAESLGGAGGVSSDTVPTSTEDFHGDGMSGQVCVVRSNRLLIGGRQSKFGQPFLKCDFCGRDVEHDALLRDGALAKSVERHLSSTASSVGSLGVSPMIFRRSLGHHQPIGFDDASSRYTCVVQTTGDSGSTYLKRICDRLFGFPRRVSLCNAFNWKLDAVLNIRRRRFSGHVYNLETSKGWFVANGIITKNCRCRWVRIDLDFHTVDSEGHIIIRPDILEKYGPKETP